MTPRDQILARTYVVLTLLALLPLGIAVQVIRVYLTEGAALRERGREQAETQVKLPARRGKIVDQEGRILATNIASYDLALDPKVKGFAEQANDFYGRMALMTGRSAAYYQRKVQQRSSPRYVLLRRGLPREQKEKVAAWDVPGVILIPRFKRQYTYERTAAHVLGHVSADGHGLAGLELQYDEQLHGTPGRRVLARNRRGATRAPVEGTVIPPEHGQTLRLTIDLVRQSILEEELRRGVRESGAQSGTAVAMDPQTGAVLAMANVPTYDPNRPAAFSASARRNRAITDRFEPGSTFKLATAVAALEEGVIAMNDSVETGEGWAVVQGRSLHDTRGHGTITFTDVIAQSSNIGAAKTATRLTPTAFYEHVQSLGFGKTTGVNLPGEVAGTLRSPSRWSGTTLTSMSIGYEVAVTPLQLLTAYCALANGGRLVEPHVVRERRNGAGATVWQAEAPPDSMPRAFSKTTAQKLLPAFERVVNAGTAEQAQLSGLRVAGKTGTARKVKGGRYETGAYRSSFVGFFPSDDSEVALLVVMDEPDGSYYGGAVAAPVFRRVARRWIDLFPKVAKRLAPAPPAQTKQPVPGVRKQPAGVARARLAAAGYQVSSSRPEPDLRTVTASVPAAGALLTPGRPVTLSTTPDAGAPSTMPDLTDLGARQAHFWLQAGGADVRIEGSGQVVRQHPAAGAKFPDQAVLYCQ